MAKVILVGCDLHEASLVLQIAVGRDEPVCKRWRNNREGRRKMIEDLHRRAHRVGARRIVFAYEACGFGFVLHDELAAAGIECHVLAPTRIPRSTKHRHGKNDKRDALGILALVRAYALAGADLPSIWIPDLPTRDDRELVRQRVDATDRLATVKTQIRWLTYRNGLEKPAGVGPGWSASYLHWLCDLADRQLSPGTAAALGSLLRRHDFHVQEKARLQQQVEALAETDRFRLSVAALCRHKGVGLLTAMAFLTELGSPERFANRREVGAFFGMVPKSSESGEDDDHKGHITHEGSGDVRKLLCQATWSRIASDPQEAAVYQRLVARNPKHKKIALVARMRQLAIRLWHDALDVHCGRPLPPVPSFQRVR